MAAPVATLAQPARIASINMCTDQLLLDLAEPAQIMGLSPYARDGGRSYRAGAAQQHRILSGTAEELMLERPDLVVSGRFTRRSTQDFLRHQGVRVEEFDVAASLADARAQILRMGRLTGHEAMAEVRVAELDRRIATLRASVEASGISILPLQRRGWVSGQDSLLGELIRLAGARNPAPNTRFRAGGFLTLEAVVALAPDALLVTRDVQQAEDQGRAMLLHPAISALFPPERRIILPERFVVCGGSMLADALEVLERQIRQIRPRDAR